jgi:formamidopyrimidine-DNA glycosylase
VPELPEVETLRRDLVPVVVGRRFEHVVVTGSRTVRRLGPQNLVDGATSRSVVSIGRLGKYLLWQLDDGGTMVVHLRMSGQVLLAPPDEPRPLHTHVVFRLDGGEELRFVDPRTFGEVFVVLDGLLADVAPDVATLGPDALTSRLSAAGLAKRLDRGVRLKTLLTDQHVIAGIGNIYADEIAWVAGVRHDRPGRSLTPDEVAGLRRAMSSVLRSAIQARGSSLADEQYVDLNGRLGSYQLRFRVHGRVGLPCRRCGTTVERVVFQGRSTYFCPGCQR